MNEIKECYNLKILYFPLKEVLTDMLYCRDPDINER